MSEIEYRRDIGGWMVRWNADLAERAVRDGDWVNCTIAQLAAARVAEDPGRVMLIDGERALTANELYRKAQRLAGWMIDIGLKAGDVISFQLPNWWEAAVIDLSASMIGVVVNPIVPINRDSEVGFMLGESRSHVFFIPELFRKFDYVAMMRRILPSLINPPRVVVVRGTAAEFDLFEALLDVAEPLSLPLAVDPNAVRLLMYTSGTTGRPKGVLHSHNSILADCVKMKPVMHLTDKDTTFCPSPLTHVSGYLWILNMPWYGNIPAVMIDIWEPRRALALLKLYRCSFMLGATAFLQDIVAIGREQNERLASLRYYLCGGAAVPPSLIYEAAELFSNCIPWRNFGATEVPTMTQCPATRADIRFGAETDGLPYRADVKIIDLFTGAPVLPGEEGEILAREPSMALGYARADDNEGAYDDEGFFRMGDLCRIVEQGHLLCTGRKKDLIIRAGENISAKEIEDVLFRSAKVIDAAVVSMPSKKTGEAICAFIVSKPGESIDLREVDDMMRAAGLARQKTPEYIQLIEALPKTASGKVRKDQLRKMAIHFAFN